MVRKNALSAPKAVVEERRLIWNQTGQRNTPLLTDWDPKEGMLVEALLEVLASGATVVLRPGSGARSIGLAIWEGDARHAPEWCYEASEIDDWARGILAVVAGRRPEAAD
jgi:hypothetical protein